MGAILLFGTIAIVAAVGAGLSIRGLLRLLDAQARKRIEREQREAEHLEFMRQVRDRVMHRVTEVDRRVAETEAKIDRGIRRPKTFRLEDE